MLRGIANNRPQTAHACQDLSPDPYHTQTIADDPVIKRPGRKEPRVCKDRQNKYTLMTKPRRCYGPADDLAHAA